MAKSIGPIPPHIGGLIAVVAFVAGIVVGIVLDRTVLSPNRLPTPAATAQPTVDSTRQ